MLIKNVRLLAELSDGCKADHGSVRVKDGKSLRYLQKNFCPSLRKRASMRQAKRCCRG